MKKPTIKNWIKYWSTAIALTAMLAVGACDNKNDNTSVDSAVDAAGETASPAREDVSRNLEEEAEVEAVQAGGDVLPPRRSTTYDISGPEQDRDQSVRDTRTKSDGETLPTGANDQTIDPQGLPLNNGIQNDGDELNSTEAETNRQENITGPTNQNNENTKDRKVTYETDRRGTTEMRIENSSAGAQVPDLETGAAGAEIETTQGTQPGTMYDSQGESYNTIPSPTEQESPADMYTPGDSVENKE